MRHLNRKFHKHGLLAAAVFALLPSMTHPGWSQGAGGAVAAAPAAVALLYEAAKKEGVVTSQGPLTVQQMEPLVKAFEARYPGVKLTYTNQTAGQTAVQLVTETAAGKVTVDAPVTYLPAIQPLLDRDILMRFDGWTQLGISKDYIQLDGRYVYFFDSAQVVAYNTDLVPAAAVPKNWNDLLDPRWKDSKLILDSRGFFIAGLSLPEGLGLEQILKISAALKDQKPLFVPRNAVALDQLAAGQAPLAAIPLGSFISTRSNGAPIALTPISPVFADTFGMSVTKGAAHPNAAKLLVAWLMTPEARTLLDKSGFGFTQPCSASSMAKLLCDNNIKVVSDQTLEQALAVASATAKVQEALGTKAN